MICSACVTPKVLKNLVNHHGLLGTCSYCNKSTTAVESKFLFNYIYERVKENIAAEDDLSSYEHVVQRKQGLIVRIDTFIRVQNRNVTN